jgi:hypothetical protein
MVDIVSRYTTSDREQSTSIDGLFFGRRASPTQPLHTSARPCFALVLQGEKSLTLGDQSIPRGMLNQLSVRRSSRADGAYLASAKGLPMHVVYLRRGQLNFKPSSAVRCQK